MSGLEDGEIASDHETLVNEFGDFNDESLIDQLVERGNETARRSTSPNVCVTSYKSRKPLSQNDYRTANSAYRAGRRSDSSRRRQNNLPPSTKSGPSTSTWHTSGSRQTPRPPPPESVMFPPSSYDMPRSLNPDICRLQSLINHTRGGNYYPTSDTPPIFFPSPRLTHVPPTLAPPAPPMPPMFLKSVSPVPSSFRGGNFEEVAMEESDDQTSPEVQPVTSTPLQTNSFVGNQFIRLEPPPPPPSGALLAAQRESRDASKLTSDEKNISNISIMSDEDPDALRQMLLSQMKQRKKRRSSRNSNRSPEKQSLVAKKSRTNSSSSVVASRSQKEVKMETKSSLPSHTPGEHSPQKEIVTETASHTFTTAVVVSDAVPAQASDRTVLIPAIVSTSTSTVSLTAQSSKEDLQQRHVIVEKIYQDNRRNIDVLKKEYDGLVQRIQEIKSSMNLAREKIKSAVTEKREIQTWLDQKEMEELDVIFDDSELVNFRTPVIKVENPQASVPAQEEPVQEIQKFPQETVIEAKQEPCILANHSVQEKINQSDDLVEPMSGGSIDSENDSGTIASADNDSDDEKEDDDEDDTGLHLQAITSEESSDVEETEIVATGLSAEMTLREKLLAKCNLTRQSPEVAAQIVSSSSAERAESCRNLLLKMCKFGLNGTCGRGRDCAYLHLHQINDSARQNQLLESIFRDVLSYNEIDIDPAIDDVMKFLPHFREYEKLIQKFLLVVMKKTPAYKNRLFELFVTGR